MLRIDKFVGVSAKTNCHFDNFEAVQAVVKQACVSQSTTGAQIPRVASLCRLARNDWAPSGHRF